MALYENMTSERIEKRMLANVPTKYDKREGSIIYDATAPAAIELAEAYIMARVILMQTFATTADRPYLALRAAEFNIYPEEATQAEVEAKFSRAIDIGTRFNYDNLNFIVTELINDIEHTYKMKCETAGIAGNNCIGNIIPIDPISNLTSAQITKVIAPGEDEEDTETFRLRYFAALKSKAFGGNGADYQEKVLAIAGVGGVKVYRCWNGGGTVKLVILNTQYELPTQEMIDEVQEQIDPPPQGKGYGLAPIGHIVTVVPATAITLNISASLIVKQGYTADDVKTAIQNAVNEYLEDRRKEWCKQSDTEYIVIRVAFILTAMLSVQNVIDVSNVKVNEEAERIMLNTDEVPILGEITLTEAE